MCSLIKFKNERNLTIKLLQLCTISQHSTYRHCGQRLRSSWASFRVSSWMHCSIGYSCIVIVYDLALLWSQVARAVGERRSVACSSSWRSISLPRLSKSWSKTLQAKKGTSYYVKISLKLIVVIAVRDFEDMKVQLLAPLAAIVCPPLYR